MVQSNIKKEDIAWIWQSTSRIAYGEKTSVGVRPNISKRNIFKNDKILARKIPRKKIQKHLNGEQTIYYYGSGSVKDQNTLVMIDVDVQKSKKLGSTQGAYDFINHIKLKFPNLYYEPSTNGKGIHAYIILKKENNDAKRINSVLKGFENWCRAESEKIKADIETVEIKGNCPEIIYKNKKPVNIKYGTLAKLPRNINAAKNSCTISIEKIIDEFYIEYKKEKKIGSCSGKLFSKKDIDHLKQLEMYFNNEIKSLKANKWRVTSHDFAIALMILLFIYKNPNIDQSIPTERVKELWISLYKSNDIQRNWNHHRWKSIRDHLSQMNLIEWFDNKYSYGNKEKNIKGIACKWKLKEKYVLYVLNYGKNTKEGQERAPLMDTNSYNKEKEYDNINTKRFFIKPILRFLLENDRFDRVLMNYIAKHSEDFEEKVEKPHGFDNIPRWPISNLQQV